MSYIMRTYYVWVLEMTSKYTKEEIPEENLKPCILIVLMFNVQPSKTGGISDETISSQTGTCQVTESTTKFGL